MGGTYLNWALANWEVDEEEGGAEAPGVEGAVASIGSGRSPCIAAITRVARSESPRYRGKVR